MLKLYDYVLSANCYKVRLFLSFLGMEAELIAVDFYPGWEHKSKAFKKINPLGHIPVLDDSGYLLRDSHAILTYLAARYDRTGRWFPVAEPKLLGETAQWLLFTEGTTNTASAARLHDSLSGYEFFDIEACRAGAHRLFRVLDEHLWFGERAGRDWVCSSPDPTLADLAIFPDVMLSEEGGVSRQDYPALRRWTDRFRRIPGFVTMPGIVRAGPAA